MGRGRRVSESLIIAEFTSGQSTPRRRWSINHVVSRAFKEVRAPDFVSSAGIGVDSAAELYFTRSGETQYLKLDEIGLQAAAGRKPVAMRAVPSHDQLADKVSKWEFRLYKAEVIHRCRPWRSFEAVEIDTLGMAGLVQQPAAPGAHRKHPAGRSRGTPLRHAGAVRHGGVTQTKWPPPNPARFRQLKRKDDQYGREFPARL